jgi:hypothetical protein
MTNNEMKLLNIIKNHDNPEKAIEIAVKTIIAFLEQDESSQEPPLVYSQALV